MGDLLGTKTRLFCLYFIATFFVACKPSTLIEPDEGVDVPPGSPFFYENGWIYQQMSENYLWAEYMPLEDSTDKSLDPENYFYSLLYKSRDRYSYFKDDLRDITDYWDGNLESYGFRYTRFKNEAGGLSLAVSLVLKDSPSELAGLRRGDIIHTINGETIGQENIETLLALKNASMAIERADGSRESINLTKRRFQLQPNHLYKIIESNQKKIGYWVYVQFLFNYEEETRAIFQYFKENNIDELIVDFRFNQGGVTPNTELIASLMGPDLDNKTLLFKGDPSPGGTGGGRNFTGESNNISHLERVFVLTSNSTASSSELIINCLDPYRKVYTLGSHTYGKNVISIFLSDPAYEFGLMPAWIPFYNVLGEKSPGDKNGIVPDIVVDDNILPYQPLGDQSETLLNAVSEVLGLKFEKSKGKEVELTDSFHYFDTGTGFLENERYD